MARNARARRRNDSGDTLPRIPPKARLTRVALFVAAPAVAVVPGLAALGVACSSSEQRVAHDTPYAGVPWSESRPTANVPLAALAMVTNNASDTLSLLDLSENRVVVSAPVGVDPIANNGPHHLAIDAAGAFVYTPLAFPAPAMALGPHAAHGASEIPGVLLKVRASDLAPVGSVTTGNNPGDVALAVDDKRVFVSHFDLRTALLGLGKKSLEEVRSPFYIVDTATMSVVGAPKPCIAAHGVALSSDGKRAYLACYGEDAIAVVRLDDPAFASELWPIGDTLSSPATITRGPYFVALTSDQKSLLVAETEGNEVRIIDVATHKTVAVIPVRGAALGPQVSADGARWIVPTQKADQLVAIESGRWTASQVRTFKPGECLAPHQVARRGDRWFVVCEGDHVTPSGVLEIDPVSLATIRTFTVGAYPDMITFPGAKP